MGCSVGPLTVHFIHPVIALSELLTVLTAQQMVGRGGGGGGEWGVDHSRISIYSAKFTQ